jgi:hypothetical protein
VIENATIAVVEGDNDRTWRKLAAETRVTKFGERDRVAGVCKQTAMPLERRLGYMQIAERNRVVLRFADAVITEHGDTGKHGGRQALVVVADGEQRLLDRPSYPRGHTPVMGRLKELSRITTGV